MYFLYLYSYTSTTYTRPTRKSAVADTNCDLFIRTYSIYTYIYIQYENIEVSKIKISKFGRRRYFKFEQLKFGINILVARKIQKSRFGHYRDRNLNSQVWWTKTGS